VLLSSMQFNSAEEGWVLYSNNVGKMVDCVKQGFELNLSDMFLR
jgi:hypothetical protein